MMSVILVTLLMAMILAVGMATGAQDAVHSNFSSTTGQSKSVDRSTHLALQKLEKEIASLQKEASESISTVKKLQMELDDMKTYSGNILMLTSAVKKLESDFLALETKTDNNNMVVKSDVLKLQTEINDLKSKTDNSLVLKSDVSKLQTETKGLKLKTDNSLVLKSDVSKLQTELEHLKSKTALLNEKVYFKATFEAVTLTVQPGTVVFDKVLVNWGFAYDPRFGIFTAPRAGLYAFTVQTFNFGKNDSNFDLRVNGNMILRGRSYTQFDTSNSYTLPIILRPGDHVHVYNRAPAPVYGYGHTLIAGWLIKAL